MVSRPDRAEDLSRLSIAASAKRCQESFHASFDRVHEYDDGGARRSKLRDLIGRLNIWASRMGVFATLDASLDYRLRDLADMKELILEHLRNLIDRSVQLHHLLRSPKTFTDSTEVPVSKGPTESDGHEEIDSILTSVSNSIDWLHRLANMVRRASDSPQNVEASTFGLKDEQGGDATPVLMNTFRDWVKRDFPNIADDFCERLVFTMLLRHRRILYRRSRQAKLGPHAAEPTLKPTGLTAPFASAGVTEQPRELLEARMSPTLTTSGVALTPQSATTIKPQADLKLKSAPSRVSGTKTIPTIIDNNMIPLPPRLADYALEFICPYCTMVFPAKDARDRGLCDVWTAHVMKDLEPYVCHFFPCGRGEDIFSTSTEWISHMQQTHCMRWHCRTKTHRPQTFMSMDDYVTHMTVQHPGKFEEAQLPLLAANSQRPLREIFKSCPLCGEDDIGNGASLENHVADHLQYLALLSLPLPEDMDKAKSADSTSHHKSSIADFAEKPAPEAHPLPKNTSHNKSSIAGFFDKPGPEARPIPKNLRRTAFPRISWLTENWLSTSDRHERIAESTPGSDIGIIAESLLDNYLNLNSEITSIATSIAGFVPVRDGSGQHLGWRAKRTSWPLSKRDTLKRDFD